MELSKLREKMEQGCYQELLCELYAVEEVQAQVQQRRYSKTLAEFTKQFDRADCDVSVFSAPGRTEVGGNHTDHQHGRVLAAGVNLDVIAVVESTADGQIQIKSEGFPMDTIDLLDLSKKDSEENTAAALIRGIAHRFQELGYAIGGFRAYTTSNVLKGSGLSSSAAFEVLVGTILNHLFNQGAISAVEIAQISQYAENVYFGKPSGLMDQTASSVGGFITIDFKDPANPVVEKIPFDFVHSGYRLCIVDTGGNHADLTPDYASIPVEMKAVAQLFGKEVLREVDPALFFEQLPMVRAQVNDRAALRAIHFFGDNERVLREVAALKANDFEQFKALILESGASSYRYLQNVYSSRAPQEQGISLALAVTEQLLGKKGAYRVHGGGFAGTIQVFVPNELADEYVQEMERIYGKGCCYLLAIRSKGGIKVL